MRRRNFSFREGVDTLVGGNAVFKGSIESEGTVRVDGKVIGNIRLTVTHISATVPQLRKCDCRQCPPCRNSERKYHRKGASEDTFHRQAVWRYQSQQLCCG